jgi:hypothetical protein
MLVANNIDRDVIINYLDFKNIFFAFQHLRQPVLKH